MNLQGSLLNRENIEKLMGQFQGLEGRHPGLWPLAPRLLCGLGAVLAVLIAGWWLILIPLWEELDAGRNQEEEQKRIFILRLQQAKDLDQLRVQKMEMHRQVQKLEQQLPDKAEMDALLADINQAGINRGLQFELFKPGEIKLHDFYAELSIDMKLTGNFHALAAFVSDIAHLPRIVVLDGIMINSLREGVQSFETVAHTFRYLDKDELDQKKKMKEEKRARGKNGAT